MNGILDVRTVFVDYVVSAAICLAVVVPVWVNNRRRRPGIGFWLVDYALQIVALLLITLRGVVPDFASAVVANTLIVGGTVLLYTGLRRFIGRGGTQFHNYAMLAVFASVQTYFTLIHPSLAARNVNISAGLLFITAQVAWLLLRVTDPEMLIPRNSGCYRPVRVIAPAGSVTCLKSDALIVDPVPETRNADAKRPG